MCCLYLLCVPQSSHTSAFASLWVKAVSADGTHLGHNLPDGKGNRYCINLVSVAGKPEDVREL